MTRTRVLCAVAFAIALLSASLASSASAATLGTPVVVSDNPSCATLNANADPAFAGITSDFGFKIDAAAPNGTYPFKTDAGAKTELTGGALQDLTKSVTILNSNGTTFDWTSTIGIDAVIVKGGPDSNAYVYTPEAFADSGLLSPPNGGGTPQVSHVEFCFDYDLTVSKTASPAFKRTWTWDIDKTGDKSTGGPVAAGDAFNVNYDVTVGASSADSDYAVTGTITVRNTTPVDATVTSVSDQLPGAVVDCDPPGLPKTLQPNEELTCNYVASGLSGNETTNTAVVGTSGAVGGGSANAAIDWSQASVNEIDECVDVTDDKKGALGTVCAPQDLTNGEKTFSYTLDAANGGTCFTYTNTASFKTNDTQATGSDSWTVTTSGCSDPQPTPPQQQVLPQQQQQGEQQVLGDSVVVRPGTARFAGATGCQGKAFTVRVKGRSISRVEFSIDGKKRKTVSKPDSSGRYAFTIDPRKFKVGSHRVAARTVFDSASGTRPKTMSLRFSRCVRAAQAPAFTG